MLEGTSTERNISMKVDGTWAMKQRKLRGSAPRDPEELREAAIIMQNMWQFVLQNELSRVADSSTHLRAHETDNYLV